MAAGSGRPGATAPQALALLNGACAAAIVHHSARTLRYALATTKREDVAVDHAALVHACLLHDLGASVLVRSAERFEVQGADAKIRCYPAASRGLRVTV